MLPREVVQTKFSGVWNLSAEQGNLGTFVVTNIRLVWYAQMSENFNVSLPLIQVKCIKIRESKFGTAFVVETSEFSGGYVLGFKVNEVEEAFTVICAQFTEFLKLPYYGVECVYEDADAPLKAPEVVKFKADIIEVVETGYE
jgi:Bardet-Biedl syndrome 5 protein